MSKRSTNLAVALDRDCSPAEALEVIRAQGPDALQQYMLSFAEGLIFYVPDGEEQYYKALVFEAWERWDASAIEWQAFIASGAHPRFQPRAKQHLDEMNKMVKLHPQARRHDAEEFFDLP
ncbi:MAG TPA: hypothetical protein VGM39_09400 [Kofleriaceae bacterium]